MTEEKGRGLHSFAQGQVLFGTGEPWMISKKALEQFELAIKKYAKLADAYSLLADTHFLMARSGYVSPKYSYSIATRNAQTALTLNPKLPELTWLFLPPGRDMSRNGRNLEQNFRALLS